MKSKGAVSAMASVDHSELPGHNGSAGPHFAPRDYLTIALWWILLTVTSVLTATTWRAIDEQRIANEWQVEAESVNERLRVAIDAYAYEQQRLLRLILRQPGVVEALQTLELRTISTAVDVDTILEARRTVVEALEPIWSALREDNTSTSLYIHQAIPPRVLVRMHDRERWGESIDAIRSLPGLVRDFGTPLAGFEAGLHGGAFRAAAPVFDASGRRVIAVVELADPPSATFEFLRQRTRSRLALFQSVANEARIRIARTNHYDPLPQAFSVEGVGAIIGDASLVPPVVRHYALPSGAVITHHRDTRAGHTTSTNLWVPLHEITIDDSGEDGLGNDLDSPGANDAHTPTVAWIQASLDHLNVSPPTDATTRWVVVIGLAWMMGLLGTLLWRARILASQQRAARQALAEQLQAVLEGAEIGTWEWQMATDELSFDDRAARMIAPLPSSLPLTVVLTQFADINRTEIGDAFRNLQNGDRESLDTHLRLDRGSIVSWLRLQGRVIMRSADGKPLRVFGIITDETLERSNLLALERDAHTDSLTGLPNRRHFLNELDRCQALVTSGAHYSALVLLDLDHFKQINDQHGHDVGDDVLVEVARRLRQQVRPNDVIGRIGGEEFAIVLVACGHLDNARNTAERIRAAIAGQPIISTRGDQLSVTASIGLAELSATRAIRDTFRAADEALYAAKGAGRNRVVVEHGIGNDAHDTVTTDHTNPTEPRAPTDPAANAKANFVIDDDPAAQSGPIADHDAVIDRSSHRNHDRNESDPYR